METWHIIEELDSISIPRLSQDQLQHMNASSHWGEVKEAVFQMGAWKSPGPDGTPTAFYQTFWDITGKELIYCFGILTFCSFA